MTDFSNFEVDLDTQRPNPNDPTKVLRGDAPRTAFTKYNDLLVELNGVVRHIGPEAPSPTIAYMLWVDTSVHPAVERQRNSDNTAWGLYPAGGGGSVDITSAEIVAALGYTPVSAAIVGQNNGLAQLGAAGKLRTDQIPTDLVGVRAIADAAIPSAEKGVPNGVAGLDAGGRVPAAQLPSYVDDVMEFANLAAFPTAGETGKIYIAIDTNRNYRWTGSAYLWNNPSPGSTDALAEGSINQYFTMARVRDTVLAGLSLLTSTAITAADTVLTALGKLQAQITSLSTTKANLASPTFTGTVNGITKAMVGLGNVDNTSDAGKPISAATQTAITAVANLPVGNRNRIINGAFRINQRSYVSGAATTAGQYTLDRWKVTGTGGVTFANVNNKVTVTIPAGQALQQVIEGLNIDSGQYILTWEGTAQGRIGTGSYGASGAVSATLVGGTNTTIEFNAGTVTSVQLERGTAGTVFETRVYSAELAMCQRYCFVGNHGVTGWANGGTQSAVYCFLPAMRAVPTLTSSNVTYSNSSALSFDGITANSYRSVFAVTSTGSGTVAFTVTAVAEL